MALWLKRGPLMEAVLDGDLEAVSAAIASGCPVDEQDANGWTGAMAACGSGNVYCLAVLVAAGASLDAVSESTGGGLLHLAAFKGSLSCVEFLLGAGCDIEGRNILGRTPLMVAAEKGRLGCAKLLLSRGANLEAVDSEGNDVLEVATEWGDEECMALFRAGKERLALNGDRQVKTGKVVGSKKSL